MRQRRKRETDEFAMKPLQWIWTFIRPYRGRMALGFLLLSFSVGAIMINPYVTARIVGEVMQNGIRDRLMLYVALLCGATLLRGVSRYFMLMTFESTSQQIILNFRRKVYKRIHDQNFGFFDKTRVGEMMSRMTGDTEAIRSFIAFDAYAVYENVAMFIAALVIIFTIDWRMSAFMLSVLPVTLISAYMQSKEIKPLFSRIREQFARLNSTCEENIGGNRVVKAFTQEDYEIEKFTKENQAFYDANVASSYVWAKYLPILEFCAGFLGVLSILVGGVMVILGKLELWKMIAINGYLWMINNPMRMFGWLVNDTQNFLASLEKVSDMMRRRIYIFSPEKGAAPARLKGGVEFRDVSFRYDRNDPTAPLALKNVSFEAKPGDTIGIVGETGSGKTTLINLIPRFYDATSGEILVDGVNVKDYELKSLRKGIAAAAQDVFLFSDTVEGNIAYGDPETPMERVLDAAKTADADGFIVHMENGYDTIVGERGVGLSGGQKQRLSLARAIAADPSILILDDTTSAVDMETEHSIQTALKEKYSDRTKFIIAHRISSVRAANLILVLENGRIAESGTHEELVRRKGIYYGLFLDQYGEYVNEVAES
ncbi:MAG: ABC transporter ATP-binding protein/permease [Firmicutes bacterium]|nr:ABC transporter ATP-binding protein/permease [Bacillota bacterium]